jgi:hypothetical protein
VKAGAVDDVLAEALARAVGGELPDVGRDVARTGQRLADRALLEGEHVVTCLGGAASEPRPGGATADDDEIAHTREWGARP